jgi:hypothetical protein
MADPIAEVCEVCGGGDAKRVQHNETRGALSRKKVVPALRVAAKTAANFVGRLADSRDISFATLRVTDRFGSNAHVLRYVSHSCSIVFKKRVSRFG